VDYLASHFRIPLEAKGVVVAALQDEVEDAVEYARRYLDIDCTEYQKVCTTVLIYRNGPIFSNFVL